MLLRFTSLKSLILLSIVWLAACQPEPSSNDKENFSSQKDIYDVCIYGGTSAGVIAARSAHRMGKTVILIEPGQHLGGMTASGLGETDIGNKYAVTNLSRQFYRDLGKHYGLFEAWQFEPHVAENLFEKYIEEDSITVLKGYRIVSANKSGQRVKAITLEESTKSHKQKIVKAHMFIDCSYEGDLMARVGISYTVGRESNNKYGEKHNGVQFTNDNQLPEGISAYNTPATAAADLFTALEV